MAITMLNMDHLCTKFGHQGCWTTPSMSDSAMTVTPVLIRTFCLSLKWFAGVSETCLLITIRLWVHLHTSAQEFLDKFNDHWNGVHNQSEHTLPYIDGIQQMATGTEQHVLHLATPVPWLSSWIMATLRRSCMQTSGRSLNSSWNFPASLSIILDKVTITLTDFPLIFCLGFDHFLLQCSSLSNFRCFHSCIRLN